MKAQPGGNKKVDPFAGLFAPGTRVPNNPDVGKGLMQAIDAVQGPQGAMLMRRTYYGDAMANLPDAPAFTTKPIQSTIGMEAPTMKGLGDTSGNLGFGFPGGNPMDRPQKGQQLGMSTSPSMLGSGPRRNEPPPKKA